MLRGKHEPGWPELVRDWKRQQEEMRRRLVVRALEPLPRFVAGVDGAFSADKATVFAAAVVYDREEKRIVEVAHARVAAEFPYIPGFLSFREGPAVLAAIGGLRHAFGAICFDAQGYAHPRRCGLASHMGITLDVPAVGVAKSRLIGMHGDVPMRSGRSVALMDGDEQIGLVLRTRDGVRPLYISVGHKVDLESARRLAMACVTRYRIPEPTRQADIEVGKLKAGTR
ncbi:MAG TPA: endonuclease V [Tepidisphaeraceae bacterium]|jgi:deoxyribonuclease V